MRNEQAQAPSNPQIRPAGFTAQAAGLVRSMRPKQWLKNGFLFVPLIFDGKLTVLSRLATATAGFILFCMTSSVVYLINDLADLESDRAHPTKRHRPLAAGTLSPTTAIVAALLMAAIALPLAYLLSPWFALMLGAYLALQFAYSLWLKQVVLIDVMVVAAGFLLRVGAGAELVEAERFSPWLYLFTTMLALFLGFSKRRQELLLIGEGDNNQRAALDHYNIRLLDEVILIVTATSLLTYALYTFSAENLPTNHTMMLTIPFVMYGIFRYLYLIHVRGEGDAPDELILKDRPLQASVVLWLIAVIVALYVLA